MMRRCGCVRWQLVHLQYGRRMLRARRNAAQGQARLGEVEYGAVNLVAVHEMMHCQFSWILQLHGQRKEAI